MKKRVLFYLLSLVVAFTSCKGNRENSKGDNATIKPTTVEFEKVTHDFGDIKEGEIVTCTFKFKNTGEHDFVISNIETTCGCTVPKHSNKPVKPGKSGEIEITFYTYRRYGRQYKSISIHSNSTNKITKLTLTANVSN